MVKEQFLPVLARGLDECLYYWESEQLLLKVKAYIMHASSNRMRHVMRWIMANVSGLAVAESQSPRRPSVGPAEHAA
jgi:hypothetical protein